MMITNSRNSLRTLATLTCVLLSPVAGAQDQGAPLPDPDGKSANMSKRVQVYILMGRSNMLGSGKINGGNGSLSHAIKEKGKYPYLVDDSGGWTVRKDGRNVRVMGRRAIRAHRAGHHLWLQLPRGMRGDDFVADAERCGIGITDAEWFAIGGTPVPEAVRLCYGAARSRAELEWALLGLGDLLGRRSRR